MTTAHLTRQLEIIPLAVLGEKLTIIGAGAIGSWVTLALAKMGFSDITVFDDDTVSVENMNCQFFPFRAIGKPKVEALKDLVKDFTHVEIVAKNEKYLTGTFKGIVISAVDSMAVRRTIWENHSGVAFGTRAIIDPRMGAETALLYAMDPLSATDIASYPKSLYSDNQAAQERCTAKSTIYTANMLSGLVCKTVKDLLTRQDYLRHAQWSIAENEFISFKRKLPN